MISLKDLLEVAIEEKRKKKKKKKKKRDACYYKVKARYKIWPSAYASGALVQCRKKGAKKCISNVNSYGSLENQKLCKHFVYPL